jgi:hypothetical protein
LKEVDSSQLLAAEEPERRESIKGARVRTGETKQIYSLRVEAKPVGAVVSELGRRLNWHMEFDSAAIKAAGLSLDKRVSFAVEDVEQEELLEAVLGPAGLTFRREGARIIIVPALPKNSR